MSSDYGSREALESIRALVRPELQAVDEAIRSGFRSAVPLVDQVAEHIIGGGGKRLRPLLVVLAGRACDPIGMGCVQAAAFIEFIHTATLLHDDVVDMSVRRRGRDTANEVYGNQASVLVGDFVYSRAFQLMAATRSQRVIEIMADATNVIAEGEVLQLMNAHDPDTTEQRYLEVIYRKTAKLFEAGVDVFRSLAEQLARCDDFRRARLRLVRTCAHAGADRPASHGDQVVTRTAGRRERPAWPRLAAPSGSAPPRPPWPRSRPWAS